MTATLALGFATGFGAWDWNAIYLTCFGIGLVLSVIGFFGGFLHLHAGHLHLGGHGSLGAKAAGLRTHGAGSPTSTTAGPAHISPLNGFTVVAFLCWFGGTGYLLHRANIFTGAIVLFFAALSGTAGAALVFWFLMRVLLPQERALLPADTEMTGVIGRVSGAIPAGGYGEIIFSQNGSRRSATVRSEDGLAIERGAEVVVMRHARGVAYVRRWDEFEDGLMGTSAGHGQGSERN